MSTSTNDNDDLPVGVSLRNTLNPSDVGYLTRLHGVLYANEYGWDQTFEAYVAGPLSEFARSNAEQERIWIVEREGTVAGSIAIVQASSAHAQLRWFLLHPDLRGKGIGRLMMKRAIDFSRTRGYLTISLWTTSDLTAAARLYESFGFHITEQNTHEMWGAMVTEQRYELRL